MAQATQNIVKLLPAAKTTKQHAAPPAPLGHFVGKPPSPVVSVASRF